MKERKETSFAIGSALAAFLASLCCLGPLLLGGAGLGAVLVSAFAPWRPYFLAASVVLLAAGFYFVYRQPRPKDACAGQACEPADKTRRIARPVLWVAVLAVAALAFFPTYGARLMTTPVAAPQVSSAPVRTTELKITGMNCQVCAKVIQRKLLLTSGVENATVRYPAGTATVRFNTSQTGTSALLAVVRETGYRAEVLMPMAMPSRETRPLGQPRRK